MNPKKSLILLTIFLFLLMGTISAQEIEDNNIEKSSLPYEGTKEKTNLETENIEMYYKDGTRFNAKLTDSKNNPLENKNITINLNHMNYTRTTNKEGVASLALNLNSGNYLITTTFDGDNNLSKVTAENHLIINPRITGENIEKIFRNGTKYTAKFLDENGSPLTNTSIEFNINGVLYTRTTDNLGIASLNINLNPGEYIITAYNPKSSERHSNIIRVLPNMIENKDLIKYHRNGSQYSVKVLDFQGNVAKSGQNVTFNINGVFYTRSTNNNGIATLSINLNPGKYIITATYNSYSVSNNITVKSLFISNNLYMYFRDGSRYSVKILDGKGQAIKENTPVTFNINGVFYTRNTNSNGIASLNINLNPGEYIITTAHDFARVSNEIIIQDKCSEKTSFTHETLIPNYVNVTYKYIEDIPNYTIKSGENGIIKLPKNQIFTVKGLFENYTLSNNKISGIESIVIGDKILFYPNDHSGIQIKNSMDSITSNGLIIYCDEDNVHFKYIGSQNKINQFGTYLDQIYRESDDLVYVEQGVIPLKINIKAVSLDEKGLKESLIKYNKLNANLINSYDYFTLTNKEIGAVKFTEVDRSVTYSQDLKSIIDFPFREYFTTILECNGETVEKREMVLYSAQLQYTNQYNSNYIQSYAFVKKELTKEDVENWIAKSGNYDEYNGLQYVYSLFLTNLQTVLLSDEYANNYSGEYEVSWIRDRPAIIMSGINSHDLYIHIANADMGMTITGDNETKIKGFRFICSAYLPEIENYCLQAYQDVFWDEPLTPLEEILESIISEKSSKVTYNNLTFIFLENGKNSTVIVNNTSGLVNVLTVKDGFAYKGTCGQIFGGCWITTILRDVVNAVTSTVKYISKTIGTLVQKIHPTSKLAWYGTNTAVGVVGGLIKSSKLVYLGLVTTFHGIQHVGVQYRTEYVEQKEWYNLYDTYTFTRPGYFQDKKVYNIPNNNGGYDYIEVPIKQDNSLDRSNAVYYSESGYRNLSKDETYQYFTDETWSPFAVPQKYWHESWQN